MAAPPMTVPTSADDDCSTGGASVTATEAVTDATFSLKLSVMCWSITSEAFVYLASSNPGAETATEYRPGGTLKTVKLPSAPLTPVNFTPFELSVAVMVAPRIHGAG